MAWWAVDKLLVRSTVWIAWCVLYIPLASRDAGENQNDENQQKCKHQTCQVPFRNGAENTEIRKSMFLECFAFQTLTMDNSICAGKGALTWFLTAIYS